MPERNLRFVAAALGGFIYSATQLLLPDWLRRTRLYDAIVAGLLRIAIELVGDARGILENTSGLAADTLDTPPLNVSDLRQAWRDMRLNATGLPNAGGLAGIYSDMQQVANQEGSSLPSLSGSIGSAAARAGVQTGQTHIFDFYVDSFRIISREGLATYMLQQTLPYRLAAASHFDPSRITHTERFLRRLRR